MPFELRILVAGAICSLVAGLLVWLQRRGHVDLGHGRVRRGTGHALLGLQELIEPSVEHVLEVENREPRFQEDGTSSGERGPLDSHLAALAAALDGSPIQHAEVRSILASAHRSGLDWKRLYDLAVRRELEARPFRSPSLPPPWRVDPGLLLNEGPGPDE